MSFILNGYFWELVIKIEVKIREKFLFEFWLFNGGLFNSGLIIEVVFNLD